VRRIPSIICIFAVSLVFASCGDDTKTVTETTASGQVTTRTVPDVKFAKTKFVIHGGLAYGAFHRYVYKPYKAGSFKKGAPKRKRSIAKAAVAGAFTLNELRLMRNAALSDDKLRPLADRISKIVPTLAALATTFKGGGLGSAADLTQLSTQFDDLVRAAKAAGVDVPTDKVPPIPGL
jgi:hypothetical protein